MTCITPFGTRPQLCFLLPLYKLLFREYASGEIMIEYQNIMISLNKFQISVWIMDCFYFCDKSANGYLRDEFEIFKLEMLLTAVSKQR